MTVLPSVSRYSLGWYVASVPMTILPALLIFSGSLAASASSTVAALAEVAGARARARLGQRVGAAGGQGECGGGGERQRQGTGAVHGRPSSGWLLGSGCRGGPGYGGSCHRSGAMRVTLPSRSSLWDDAHPSGDPARRTSRDVPRLERAPGPPLLGAGFRVPRGGSRVRVTARPRCRPPQRRLPGPRGGQARNARDQAVARPRRPVAALHPRGGRGVARHRRGPHAVDPLHRPGQHRRGRQRRHRGPRPRRHRPARRDAGHGGQGGALQALRRHRRGARGHGVRHGGGAGRAPSRASPRRSAGSTSRTSRPRAASRSRSSSWSASTSPSSTTTSTGRRSSCSPVCSMP